MPGNTPLQPDTLNDPVTVRELTMLQQQFDNHLVEYKIYREEENTRWTNLLTVQMQNTMAISEQTAAHKVAQADTVEAIKALTLSTQDVIITTQSVADSTKDIIATWEVANGVIKFGSILGKFAKWLTGFGAVVTGTVYYFNK